MIDNEPDRWIDVRWDLESGSTQRFPARIKLQSINEPGSLAQITQVIADHDGNISHAATALGISRVALQKKMKEYNLR